MPRSRRAGVRRNPPAEFKPFAAITRSMGKGRPFEEYIEAVQGRGPRRNPDSLSLGTLAVYGLLGYVAYKAIRHGAALGHAGDDLRTPPSL